MEALPIADVGRRTGRSAKGKVGADDYCLVLKWEWVAESASVSRKELYARKVRQRNCALMGAVTLSGDGVSLPVLRGLRQSPLWQLGDPG